MIETREPYIRTMKTTDSQVFHNPQSPNPKSTVIEDLPVMVFQGDGVGRITAANRAWRRGLGYDPKECVGRELIHFAMPEHRPRLRAALQAARAGGGAPTILECALLHATGQPVEIELRLNAPAPNEMLGVLSELTARKSLEAARWQDFIKEQQMERLEGMGLLASGIAHDFNNLLTGMLGNADLALAKLSPFSPGCEHIRGIVTHARRAADLCKQMLAYAGKSHFMVGPVDLNLLLQEMKPMLVGSLPLGIELEYRLDPGLQPIQADTAQIQNLVTQLFNNAAEAIGEEGGTITFATALMDCSTEYLEGTFPWGSGLEQGPYVTLEVSDNGCGLAEEERQRIFDPFFSTKYSSQGLGLASVLGIVRGHEGTLLVRSELGYGTSIRAHFPGSATPVMVPTTQAQEDNMDSSAGTILVVDDEEIVRSVARGMLELLGYHVLTASDGREALEIYRQRQHEIVLIVLDLAMPLMSGDETFEAIRALRPDAKVVLSSGYDEQEATQRFAGKGLAGFIQKPYEVAAFSRIIHDALESGAP